MLSASLSLSRCSSRGVLLVEALAPPIQEPGYPDEKDDVDDEADGDEGHHEEAHPAAGGGEQVDGYWWANEGLHDGTSVASVRVTSSGVIEAAACGCRQGAGGSVERAR